MIKRDPQRFFSATQRAVLFELAEGRCQVCSEDLTVGWHADHRIPWADGGPTTIENGQALCEGCNSKKGRGKMYSDSFTPRPFQSEVANQVLDGIRSGRDRTVVLASPGSGKTLAYLSLATRLYREGLIDNIAVFVPRVALAQQCEIGWQHRDPYSQQDAGQCLLFDPARRFGKIWHRTNEVPLTPQVGSGTGFVATYSALATNERAFKEWAQRHADRFLLIADEAQFCGDTNDRDSGGTRAGALIEALHEHALHTLLLTGTPYRADNQQLVLAEYEAPDPTDKRQLRKLVHHAEASYQDGIAEGYLRTFEMHLTESLVSKRTLGDEDDRGESLLTYNLSDDGQDLADVLRDNRTWEPLVQRVVAKVRDKQKFNAAYRGLISCMDQTEAKKVQAHLKRTYPDLRVGLAVSSESDAPQALKAFRTQPMDILVTVRMAFIGYDCPEITVVGILTHYRDGGHLMQLVGRGLRVWDKVPAREQSCVIVAPEDPRMREFLGLMRAEQEQGLRRIEERELNADRASATQGPLSFVESAVATTTRAASNDTELESDELELIESIKVMVDSAEDATKLKKVLEIYGLMTKQSPPDEEVPEKPETTMYVQVQVPKTDKELIEEFKSKTKNAITSYLAACGIKPGAPNYPDAAKVATARVNDACGCNAAQASTVERAEKRLKAALALK